MYEQLKLNKRSHYWYHVNNAEGRTGSGTQAKVRPLACAVHHIMNLISRTNSLLFNSGNCTSHIVRTTSDVLRKVFALTPFPFNLRKCESLF